jgi:thiol-disulfide isomerase/thioredoxin
MSPKTGRWLVTMDMTQTTLPFYLDLTITEFDTSAIIVNNTEQIKITNVTVTSDSIHMYLPYFNSEFHGKVWKDNLIYGNWFNKAKGSEYMIPFKAEHKKEKFILTKPEVTLANRYKVIFGDSTDNYPAVAIFNQKKNKVTGTFLTETGDYRFLDGYLKADTLLLHAFDGAHAFTFTAQVKNNELINGKFYSGNHYSDSWFGTPNDTFELNDPYELTYLADTLKQFNFSFKNLNNQTVSLSDARFNDKVKIVQVMGTWCPNCMDETKYYTELYSKYKSKGLEIIALAYENDTVFDANVKRIKKYQQETGANYEFLIAGKANKALTSESLPQLNNIISYPTSIFIDKTGNVVQIHTGFYGPSTGDNYTKYKKDTEYLLEKLLQ